MLINAHVLEDALEETCEMKGCNARSTNYANLDVDDCGTLSTSEGLMLDGNVCDFLDMESRNAKFEKIRKLMNKGKEITSSKHVTKKNMSTSLCEGFKIKWFEKRKNNDGNEHEEELETMDVR